MAGAIILIVTSVLVLILRALKNRAFTNIIKAMNQEIDELLPFTEYVILIDEFIFNELHKRYEIDKTYNGLEIIRMRSNQIPYLIVEKHELEREMNKL